MNASRDDVLEAAARWCLRLAESRLSSAEDEEFRAWINADAANADAFNDATAAWESFELRSNNSEIMAQRNASLLALGRRQTNRWQAAAKKRRWAAGLAVGFCAVMAIGLALFHQVQPEHYETGIGERKVVSLSDGSRLVLDAGTEITVEYHGNERDLNLAQGRATFKVAHDPMRPFTVSVGDKAVQATGTEFSVELLSSTNEVRVVLFHGGVNVLGSEKGNQNSGARSGVLAKLAPGMELSTKIGSPEVSVKNTDLDRARAWESGFLSFENEMLAVAVERMNRQGRPKISIENPTVGSLRISGTFGAGENDAFVEGVTEILPVAAVVRGDEIAFNTK